MSTAVLWIILLGVELADRRFCIDKANRLNIEVKDLVKTRSEPLDFLYDILVGFIALNIMLIQTKITVSLVLSVIILLICLKSLIRDIRRLSNKEAE